MRLTRSYIDAPLKAGAEIALPEDVAAHLLRVLRLQLGDACVLFNGDGHDYDARITHLGRREARAQIMAARRIDNESPLRITLLQGIARGEKMDWILQKATELGVADFLPVTSDRSEVKLDAQRAEKRLAHWHGIVISACEQSGRAVLPEVAAPQSLAHAAAARSGRGAVAVKAAAASRATPRNCTKWPWRAWCYSPCCGGSPASPAPLGRSARCS